MPLCVESTNLAGFYTSTMLRVVGSNFCDLLYRERETTAPTISTEDNPSSLDSNQLLVQHASFQHVNFQQVTLSVRDLLG